MSGIWTRSCVASLGVFALAAVAPLASQEKGYVEEEVRFVSGDIELAGTLTLPSEGAGPRPAIVYLHGSGPATRDGAAFYAQRWAGLGFAGLRYDKRGTGDSGGSWTGSSLTDLARDAVAALDFLSQRPEIDAERIGFWGVSQAGWVATEAVAWTDDLAFLIVISGGGVSPRESELFSYRGAFERAGLSAAESAEGLGVVEQYMAFLASGEGRGELEAALDRASGSAWFEHARLDRILPSTEAGRLKWSWVANWDPAPLIARMRFPVLVLFGGKDTQAPPAASVEAWRRGLEAAGNTDFTIRLFPEAGHGIRLWREGHHEGGHPPFADGYLEAMDAWLVRTVLEIATTARDG